MNHRFGILAVLGIFWSVPAVSHHSSRAYYAMDEQVTVEGVVTEFLLVNPHARIYLDVTTPAGDTVTWMAEGEAASVLRRQNWTNEILKKGEFISIVGNPALDGGDQVEWKSITLSDGRVLGGGNGQGDERAAFFERRRKNETSE